MTSIRRHLLIWLLSALLLGVLLLALASFLFTLEEMNEVFDDELKQVAMAVLDQHRQRTQPGRPGLADAEREATAFVTQVWALDGSRIFSSMSAAEIGFDREAGLKTVNTQSGAWRVYTAPSAAGIVQVAQPADAREALAADVSFKLLIPSLLMVPVFALLLIYALRRGLRPLAQASEAVERKSAVSLDPIPDATLPEELHALVASINGLMLRLSGSLAQQRMFIADAAHELRTPLTALRLQLELARQATNDRDRGEAFEDIRSGIDRSTHLVAQLLNLSRLEPDAAEGLPMIVDLADLARTVVGEFSAKAEAMHIDLGADAGHPAFINGDAEQLHILLNNLIDNALRYNEPYGRVDVSVRRDEELRSVTIEVCDSGRGLRTEERGRVFNRFYRAASAQGPDGIVPGTGLGLAIVKAIALRHAATIELADGLARPDGSTGLMVRIRFEEHRAGTL